MPGRTHPAGISARWRWDGVSLEVGNDRYGFYPLFYSAGPQGVAISPSFPLHTEVIAAAYPRFADIPYAPPLTVNLDQPRHLRRLMADAALACLMRPRNRFLRWSHLLPRLLGGMVMPRYGSAMFGRLRWMVYWQELSDWLGT